MRITVLSAPLEDPVRMSFSELRTRDVVLVEVEADGVVGLGESWVNYPAWAARERLATLEEGLAPLLVGLDVSDPEAVQDHLVERLGGVARQWGAPGPVWQAISAVDLALWDLAARVRGVPVWKLLGGEEPRRQVEAYASGIGPSEVEAGCEQALAAGFGAVKARVGFGRCTDERTLASARTVVGDAHLFVDANQAWDLASAREFCDWSSDYGIGWLEEPVTGNRLEDLEQLAAATDVPLACGENVYGADELARFAGSPAISLLQPDLAKSGGFTMARRVVSALRPGGRVAPHCYGGAVLAAASVQLAAACPAVTCLEVDVRPNPLRDALLATPLDVRDGRLELPPGPGLGVELDPDVVDRYTVVRKDCDLSAVV